MKGVFRDNGKEAGKLRVSGLKNAARLYRVFVE